MKIVIAGGTGFLGRHLAARLAEDGHQITLLSRTRDGRRRPAATRATADASPPCELVTWTAEAGGAWTSALSGAGAIVNLAGAPINRRWTAAQKGRITQSRVRATRALAEACLAMSSPPPAFISGSGVGYYGPCGDEPLTEAAPPGRDFLGGVCVAWEAEALRADNERTRVVCVRTGLVLARDGGALPRMLPPFYVGAGGRVGSGRQYWPWIHRHDWVELVRFAIGSAQVRGPVNATAPEPVPNHDFARALGRAMHRPALMPAPAFALRLLLGEMADGLLLSGQRALPDKAERAGFTFNYPTLEAALDELFK